MHSAVADAGIILVVTPAQVLRPTLKAASPFIDTAATLVSASKGLEEATFCRMTQVLQQEASASAHRTAALSGPTFAREVAAGEPAAIVIAAETLALAETIQQAFRTPTLRLYTSTDVVGV